MITLRLSFQSEGKEIRKTAIVTDDLTDLSASKKNQAEYIFTDSYDFGYWSLFFGDGDTQYEVEFEYDEENGTPTMNPIKAITWRYDIVVDSQKVTIKTSK
jgi:hypothetical protein